MGTFADPNQAKIIFDPSWVDSTYKFVTILAHELGHVMLAGGMVGTATSPEQASANTRSSEGTAVLSEYIVVTQLGLTGGAAGYKYSDSTDVLTQQLNQLAASMGINNNTITFGSTAAYAIFRSNSSMYIAAGVYYGPASPFGCAISDLQRLWCLLVDSE